MQIYLRLYAVEKSYSLAFKYFWLWSRREVNRMRCCWVEFRRS